ncbi:MAG: DinB family protein [Chitinophagaceae bacterium]|nr:MAG: DinB family protein [Chitinophagaceae bacterium]
MDHPASGKLAVIIPAFRMHTQLFLNVLNGITEQDALKRIEGKTNHVAWMAGNMVNCRYWLGETLGLAEKDPAEELFKEGRALDENLNYPTLATLFERWHSISPKVYEKLLITGDAMLEKNVEFGMGVSFLEENNLNMVGMAIGREDYLLGQMGLMRKILGLPGMKYDVNESIHY